VSYLIDYIKKRTGERRKNFLCCVCGATGSGKSYLSLKIASMLSPKFSTKYIVFSCQEFMELMVSGKLKKQDVIVWEEGGVSLGHRDYMSRINKSLVYFLQSFRKLRVILFITIPDLFMLDVAVRKLLHGLVVTQRIDFEKNLCQVKFFHVSYSTRSKKVYYKYPRVVKGGRVVVLDRINIGLPDKKLRESYERKKSRFLKRLGESVLKTVVPVTPKPKKRLSDEEALGILKEKLKGKVTIPRIRAIVPVSLHRASILREKLTPSLS